MRLEQRELRVFREQPALPVRQVLIALFPGLQVQPEKLAPLVRPVPKVFPALLALREHKGFRV